MLNANFAAHFYFYEVAQGDRLFIEEKRKEIEEPLLGIYLSLLKTLLFLIVRFESRARHRDYRFQRYGH